MDQDHRMECLRMAFELGGKTEPIVSAARQLLDFVHANEQQAAEVDAKQASAEPPVIEVPTSPEEQPAAEAIAACGTAMVMPEGGELADAVPTHEASQESTSAAEPAPQPAASTEEGAAVSAEEPASTNEGCEASATETSEATAPSVDPKPQTPEREGAAEQTTSEAGCTEASNNGEAPLVEKIEAVADQAMQASPEAPAPQDGAVADPPEVSH